MTDHNHLVDLATDPVTNVATGSLGIAVYLMETMPLIVASLTAVVLLCQVVAWGYKFACWIDKRKKKKIKLETKK